MANPQKRKGTRFESEIRDWLAQVTGRRVERIPAGATLDRGDLTGLDGVAIECKAVQKIELASITDEAVTEAANVSDDTLGVAIIKRRGRGPSEAYAVMKLEQWTELYRRTQ